MMTLFRDDSLSHFTAQMAAGGPYAQRRWDYLSAKTDKLDLTTAGELALSDTLILPDETGEGIKVGDTATNDWGWRDITSSIEVRGVASTDPNWTQVGSSGLYAYAFSVNDVVWMTYHIPHDYVPNSSCYFHVHWFPSGTNANSVKWQFTFVYAKGFDQQAFAFGSPTTITVEQASPGVAYQHMVAETTAQDLSITEPDGLIHCAIKRITNGATDNSDSIFGLTADIHYQSTNMATVGKAPSFYG